MGGCFRFFVNGINRFASVLVVFCLCLTANLYAMDTIFGSTDPNAGGFRGEVYVIPEKVDRIPNFTHMRSVGTLYTRTINVKTQRFDGRLPNATRSDWFAIRYIGTYTAPTDGKYRFRLKSDDGARLYIDSQLVIDNDGLHGTEDKKGEVRLTPGAHMIEVQYFQGRADVCLSLYVKEPGKKETHVVASSVGTTPLPTPPVVVQPVTPAVPAPVPQVSSGSGYAGGGGSLTGFSLYSNNGNHMGYGNNGELCAASMLPGGAWAQKPVPYNLNEPYTVTFDFKITESNNHFILIYYDDFVCVDIDWGQKISHYQPGAPYQLKQVQMGLGVNQWYTFRIEANPPGRTFDVYIDGRKVSSATEVVPGHRFLKGNSAIGQHPDTIFLGDVEPDTSYRGGTYNRGSGCWRNFSWQGGAGGGQGSTSGGFGTGTISSTGFKGNIYYLNTGTRMLPDFNTMTPAGAIYAPSLNVPNQSFTKGFPGVTDRFEWFGIRYTGSTRINQPGEYRFRLYSDDGSKLWVDGQLIINNDGIHPARNMTGSVYLDPGVHDIQVDYFQGPRVMVALMLFMTPPGGTESIFDGVYQPSGGGDSGVFGGTTYLPGSLRGDIYYLNPGTRMLPDFNTMTPVGSMYTRSLNIPNQSFTKGFPGVTDRFEWFGLRYTGSFQVETAGEFQFRCFSDDGSKVWVDGQLLINNDGVHPARSGVGKVYLNPGIHQIQVDYFQGPRVMVALQLFFTPPGGQERIFEFGQPR